MREGVNKIIIKNMICKNCKKEIDNDSKFCEFCGSKTSEGYGEIVKEILKKEEARKRKNDKFNRVISFMKKTILIVSVFIMSAFFIDSSLDKYADDMACFLLAIPATILIIFAYNKIAKKFSL